MRGLVLVSLLRKLRQVPEAFLLCAGLATIPFLPRGSVLALSRCMGRAGFLLSARLRRVALANLDLAFGNDKTAAEKRLIAVGSFQTSALALLDLFWFSFFTRSRFDRWVLFDRSFDSFFDQTPVILIGGHLGNWELGGMAASMSGVPCVGVARRLANPFVNWIVNRQRRSTGGRTIESKGAVRALLKVLRGGGRVAFLVDQNVRPSDGGVFVRFFGLLVPMTKAVAALSERTGAAIVPGTCLCDDNGMYCVRALESFSPREEGLSNTEATQRIAEITEGLIRESPEKWLWMYKRWKFVKPGESAEGYPFYHRTRYRGSDVVENHQNGQLLEEQE